MNDKRKKCLVLLASYNGASWLSGQLKSIISQEGIDVHIHICDDNSSDSTVAIVNAINLNEPHISMRKRSVGSGSAGQNFMMMFRDVDVSDFEYIALSDQDDIWFCTKIRDAVTKIQSTTSVGYSSSVTAFWPNGREKSLHQSSHVTCADFLFEGAGQGCTFVLTADFFRRVQKFCIENEAVTKSFYYHDWLVYLLSRCWGEKWFFDDRPGLSYRQHSDNDTGARSGYTSFRGRIDLIANGWYRQQIEVAIELSKKCGNNSGGVAMVESFITSKKTLRQRLSFALFLGRFGRRKFTDRIVLAFSALVGWI